MQVEYTRSDAAQSTSPAKVRIVTFRQFAELARSRSWTAQSLAQRFRGKIEHAGDFFARILSGKSPELLVPYRSVIDFYFASQATKPPMGQLCACGCGAVVFDRKKWATSGCRKKAQRKQVTDGQMCLGQVIDFVDPRVGQKRRMATLPLTEPKNANLSR